MITETTALEILTQAGAIITNSHLVYTSGRHGEAYVNKDALYTRPSWTSDLCRAIAEHFCRRTIQVVVAPAIGGVALTQWTAFHLDQLISQCDTDDVRAVYAEKDGEGFVLKRGYEALVPGKAVLVVEDILTTGGSAKKVVEMVTKLGGRVVAVAALCNRGGITAEDLGVPELFTLTNIPLLSWSEDECPLCQQGVPVNTTVGKGREFLAKKATQQ